MLSIDVKVPCKRSPGNVEPVRVYYDFDKKSNFHFIFHNACDFASPCEECSECVKALSSTAKAASTFSGLLEYYPPAR